MRQPPWQVVKEVEGLWIYKGPSPHGNWPKDVNKKDLCPDWPRILVLDLTAKQFREFDDDPVGFCRDHNLFPDQPIQWMSGAKPASGKLIPIADEGSSWTVVINHGRQSIATFAAIPQELVQRAQEIGE